MRIPSSPQIISNGAGCRGPGPIPGESTNDMRTCTSAGFCAFVEAGDMFRQQAKRARRGRKIFLAGKKSIPDHKNKRCNDYIFVGY